LLETTSARGRAQRPPYGAQAKEWRSDRLGQERFLTEHGFGPAAAYLLIYDGRSYDFKAIAGVA
jgi:hypothetical protein